MKRRPIPVAPPKPAPEPITVRIIEDLLKLPNSGDSRAFTRLSGISDAGHDSIVFAQDEKALEAVRVYKFIPAKLAGKPVPVEINVEVIFRIM